MLLMEEDERLGLTTVWKELIVSSTVRKNATPSNLNIDA